MRVSPYFSMALASALLACGASGPSAPESVRVAREIDVADFLLRFGEENVETLARPDADLETLEVRHREARGPERRAAMRALALAHLRASEEAGEPKDASTHRRSALRYAEHAARGSRDARLAAEMAFIDLWSAWRADRRGAERAAARFVERHRNPRELLLIGWIVRGEIAAREGRYDDAIASFRYLVMHLDHPLYALGLHRTADVLAEAGRDADARQAREEVRSLGCARDASPYTLEVAAASARRLGSTVVRDAEGRLRPSTCLDGPDKKNH